MKGSKNLVLKKRNCLLYTYYMHGNNPLFQGALVIGSTKLGLKNICDEAVNLTSEKHDPCTQKVTYTKEENKNTLQKAPMWS